MVNFRSKNLPKIYHFFICWSKVFTIETALLFLEIFHKLWRHDNWWTWNNLNTRYFGSFLKSKFYLLKLFWTLDNAATIFWCFELKEFKQLLFLVCWNEIWNFHKKIHNIRTMSWYFTAEKFRARPNRTLKDNVIGDDWRSNMF